MSIELEQPKNPEVQQQPKTTLATREGLQQFLRDLYDSVAKGRAITSFRNGLARVKARIWGGTKKNEPEKKPEKNQPTNTLSSNNPNESSVSTNRLSRRSFLKLAVLSVAAAKEALTPNGLLNPKSSYAAELNRGTRSGGNNQETFTDPNEILRQLIDSAKEYIATKVPMLTEYTETLEFQTRTNDNIGIQIPADIGNPPSPDGQVNKSGFELGSYTYSPYLDPRQSEKGSVYKRILEDLQTIKNTFPPEEQKWRLMEYSNALAEQILDRQKRYSDKMRYFPGKLTRVGIGAEVLSYLDYMTNQAGITDPEIKAAILRTHPHIAQIIAMLQAGFEVDIQMNGLPPEFVEPDGDNPWPIYNPIKPEAIPALQEFIKILSLALSTEVKPTNNDNQQAKSANMQRIVRLSTANEPANIHIGEQARKYVRRLLEAQLNLINNGSEITLIGPSIKTDYEGKLDTTLRIIEEFIAEIKTFVEQHNIRDPDKISKLLKCLPTLTVYARDATAFMQKTNSLVNKIMEKLKSSGLLGEGVQVEINFSEMGIEWPYYQGEGGLNRGADEMIKIANSLKTTIQRWKKSYPWLRFTSIFLIHNPGGSDYHGEKFDKCAKETNSKKPVSQSPIPIIGVAPDTNPPTNQKRFADLCKAVG